LAAGTVKLFNAKSFGLISRQQADDVFVRPV